MPTKRLHYHAKTKKALSITPLHLTCFAVLILLLSALNLIVYSSPQKTRTVYAKDNTPLIQAYYLKNLLAQHPTYREGWVALAKLENELGNYDEVQKAINHIEAIDPNYKGLAELQRLGMK